MEQLCFHCFHQHDASQGPCPHCGFDLKTQDYPLALTPGTMLNNRYYVGCVLGQGGFGITYVALDANINARVAIKEFMPSELATRLDGVTVSPYSGDKANEFQYGEERFLEEAKTLAQFIGNPNIAGVSNYFTENQTSYFVMDYIEGVSFKSYIASMGGKVPLQDALNVMIPVLSALSAVHKAGFIHRDVTPDNIFITKDGGVKLLDFGSARYSVGDRSKSLDVILKVGYAPKEQYIRRGRQGPFTDVYSCAACLYASLTGFLPPESLERLDVDELVPLTEALPEIPPYINNAILKGLAVNAEDRFQSAQEFLEAIEQQIVVALPQKNPQVAMPTKKKPVVAIVAAILAVVVIGGGAFYFLNGNNQTSSSETQTIVVDTSGNVISTTTEKTETKNDDKTITVLGQEVQSDGYFEYDGQVGDAEFAEICSYPELITINLWDADCSALTDLSPVSNMVNLKRLDLGYPSEAYCDFSSYAPLAALTQLESFSSGNNKATDVEMLSGLTNLQELQIMCAEGSDLSWLQDLTQLEELTIMDLPNATSLQSLEHLTELRQLRLESAPSLASLQGMENMTELEEFRLKDALPLTSLDGFGEKPKLLSCELYGNSIEDITAISTAVNLEILALSAEQQIGPQDLSPLAPLTKLVSLQMSFASYEPSIEALRNAKDLEELILNPRVRVVANMDLSPLADHTNLKILSLGAGIGDLSPLSNLTQLISLDLGNGYTPDNNLVTYGDLSPLANLTNLRELTLSSKSITSVESLAGLQELSSLGLSTCNISDVSPLAQLENLRSLTIYSQSIITNKDLLQNIQTTKISDASN